MSDVEEIPVKVSEGGKITIPKKFRNDMFEIQTGDFLLMRTKKSESGKLKIEIVPIKGANGFEEGEK